MNCAYGIIVGCSYCGNLIAQKENTKRERTHRRWQSEHINPSDADASGCMVSEHVWKARAAEMFWNDVAQKVGMSWLKKRTIMWKRSAGSGHFRTCKIQRIFYLPCWNGSWLKRSSRLTRSEDINRVRQEGVSFAHATIVVGILPNQQNQNRVAVIAGRSVGGAVQRNLAKRRIRSAFHTLESQLCEGYDLVIIARKPILNIDFQTLLLALRSLFERAGLTKDNLSWLTRITNLVTLTKNPGWEIFQFD